MSYRNSFTFNGLRILIDTRRGPKYFVFTAKMGGILKKRPFRKPVKGVFMGFLRAFLRLFQVRQMDLA
jgi:hypothetical protein